MADVGTQTWDFRYLPVPAPRLVGSGRHALRCPVWRAKDPIDKCRCRVAALLTTADLPGDDDTEEPS